MRQNDRDTLPDSLEPEMPRDSLFSFGDRRAIRHVAYLGFWLPVLCAGIVASAADRIDSSLENHNSTASPIEPGAKLEHLYSREAQLKSGLTEGPAVSADGLIYFTDMPFGPQSGLIMRFDPRTKITSLFSDSAGKSNGLAFLSDGSMVSCDGADGGGRRLIRWDPATGADETLCDRIAGQRLNSPNDLCVDIQDRIYFTDPRYVGEESRDLRQEAVYRWSPAGVVEITREVEKPNGIVLSPDQRTLYVGDHNNGGNQLNADDAKPSRGAMKVYAFPLDEQGLVLGPRQTLVDFGEENGCDGMTVDCDGNLYLACRSLSRPGILVTDPFGHELVFVETGPRNQSGMFEDWQGIPSNVEFGTGDDRRSLYITIDKSLYRVQTRTQGFHPHLQGK